MEDQFALIRIDELDESLSSYLRLLYETSFPEDERRDFEQLKQLLEESPYLKLYIIDKNEENIGFLTLWSFDTFVYIEHFAIQEDRRGGGAGSFVLDEIKRLYRKPIILEVELPVDKMAERRIFFYERAGFKLWKEIAYKQPPYDKTKNSIDLLLMTYGLIDMYKEKKNIISQIYRFVYQTEFI